MIISDLNSFSVALIDKIIWICFFLQNITWSLNTLHAMSIADRFLLDMEYDEGLAPVPETNMNAWMEDPRPGPNLHANPDKAVIQARGRRRIPQTFSPDRVASNQVEQETDNTLYLL